MNIWCCIIITSPEEVLSLVSMKYFLDFVDDDTVVSGDQQWSGHSDHVPRSQATHIMGDRGDCVPGAGPGASVHDECQVPGVLWPGVQVTRRHLLQHCSHGTVIRVSQPGAVQTCKNITNNNYEPSQTNSKVLSVYSSKLRNVENSIHYSSSLPLSQHTVNVGDVSQVSRQEWDSLLQHVDPGDQCHSVHLSWPRHTPTWEQWTQVMMISSWTHWSELSPGHGTVVTTDISGQMISHATHHQHAHNTSDQFLYQITLLCNHWDYHHQHHYDHCHCLHIILTRQSVVSDEVVCQ